MVARFLTSRPTRGRLLLGVAAALAIGQQSAAAQSAPRRDPTQPPAAYGAKEGVAHDPLERFRPEHVVIVDGQRYLLWQGRRYRVGDSIQGARIERIDETELWLRIDGARRKLPLFPGIEKLAPRADADARRGRTQ